MLFFLHAEMLPLPDAGWACTLLLQCVDKIQRLCVHVNCIKRLVR